MNADIANWLLESSRIEWNTEFEYMLDTHTLQAANASTGGLSIFIQGLNMEFGTKNTSKALELYLQGAAKLDPLCLCRLHDIYLGDASFNTVLDVDQALIYLAFAGIYSQDIFFEGFVVPYKKLKTFLGEFDHSCKLMQEIFKRTRIGALDSIKNLTLFLLFDFQGIESEKNRSMFLDLLGSLPIKTKKEIMFTIYLNEFRIPWTYVVKKKENLVLNLMQIPEIFENFFESYRGLVLLATKNKTLAAKFRPWLQTVLFVIDFAALSPEKKRYYQVLMPFIVRALDKGFFDGKDILCWLRYFLAYCYEKGIPGQKFLERALELIHKNMEESPEGVKYPLREALLLKQLGKVKESNQAINWFEELYSSRTKHTENSLLLFTKAKSYEKFYDNPKLAIEYYTKGSAELREDVPQKTFFFYSYWRVRCLKKLEKLNKISQPPQQVTLERTVIKPLTVNVERKLNGAQHEKHETKAAVPEVKPQPHALALAKTVKKPVVNKAKLLPETKKVFTESKVKVFSDDEVKKSTMKAHNSQVFLVNDKVYCAEEMKVDDVQVLKDNSHLIGKTFESRGPKLVPQSGVYLKENDELSVFLLTPLPSWDLQSAIKAKSFPDVKTKIHVAMQIVVCLEQIHEGENLSFYGNLKPKKILLDEYFTVKMYNPCSKLVPYQNMEKDGYTAPEQFQGTHVPQSDIWALGIIFWEIFYEEKISANDALLEGMYKGIKPKKEWRQRPRGVGKLIDKLIRVNVAQRPMLRDIHEILKGEII